MMEMHKTILETIINSIVSVVILFILTRFTGKKQVGQLTFFNYIVGITIGSIVAAFAVDTSIEYPEFITSVIIYGVFPVILSEIGLKSYFGRKLLSGKPTILVHKGEIIEENLRKTKINVNELLEQCRLKNAFNLSEVEFAILEPNGQVSVQMKSPNLPLTPKDMSISTEYQGICVNVIIDGKLIEENLKSINKDKEWLNSELKKQDNTNISDILLAYVDSKNTLNVCLKNCKPAIAPAL